VEPVVALILAAGAVGLSNFAAAIGIGLSGVDARTRLRVVIVFGTFEALMPVLGLVLGRRVAQSLGPVTAYVGGGLLVAAGSYTVWQGRRRRSDDDGAPGSDSGIAPTGARLGSLILIGAALSIDNLIVGFALGTYNVSLALAAITIAVVSVAMSLVGLELGSRLGRSAEKWSGEVGGGVLVLVGAAIAFGVF
jgi:manganese efflux pump family protein